MDFAAGPANHHVRLERVAADVEKQGSYCLPPGFFVGWARSVSGHGRFGSANRGVRAPWLGALGTR